MSERDNRMKYNRDNNIKSSMYDRVNAGRNNANNKLDGPHLTHVSGSMNNPDEERTDVTSFPYQFFFYLIGIGLSTALIFIGYLVLRERFFSVGMNQLLPSFLLVSISLVIGFYSSEKIVATFKK
ncbi:MAG: hypothetical protein WBA84_10155 [Carnobacterium sp.]|uniref:hypothetical protein n=1 Tax=Carnobacterium sp. TaxID=48221 RepID=UPI003C7610AE